jgi:hypothetical protein
MTMTRPALRDVLAVIEPIPDAENDFRCALAREIAELQRLDDVILARMAARGEGYRIDVVTIARVRGACRRLEAAVHSYRRKRGAP